MSTNTQIGFLLVLLRLLLGGLLPCPLSGFHGLLLVHASCLTWGAASFLVSEGRGREVNEVHVVRARVRFGDAQNLAVLKVPRAVCSALRFHCELAEGDVEAAAVGDGPGHTPCEVI